MRSRRNASNTFKAIFDLLRKFVNSIVSRDFQALWIRSCWNIFHHLMFLSRVTSLCRFYDFLCCTKNIPQTVVHKISFWPIFSCMGEILWMASVIRWKYFKNILLAPKPWTATLNLGICIRNLLNFCRLLFRRRMASNGSAAT